MTDAWPSRTSDVPAAARAVLDFWFGPPDDPDHLSSRKAWFVKDPAFDALIAQRFATTLEHALNGALDAWAAAPLSALARLIVLDQFTRNVFRGTPRAFAGDAQALAAAQALVASGADLGLTGVQRQFVYLPFEHAEDVQLQHQSLRLFAQLASDHPALHDLPRWAQAHHDIVARFGRFPHRNAILGRDSTAEEIKFLQTPGSSF